MKIDLSDSDESYQSSEAVYAEALPSGIHEVKLIDAKVIYSKNQNLRIIWNLEGELPSGKPGTATKFSPLVDKGFGYLKDDLRTLGITLGHLNEIYDVLPHLAGTTILIEVQDDPSTGYHKVDFIKKISGPKI